jgi:hypothetical protein
MSRNEQDARLRQAALVLHGLHWRDRLWLLRQLLPAWRSSLRGLLDELRALGIDASLGAQADLPAVLALGALDGASVQRIDQASAVEMMQLLRGQAPALQARALVLHDWRWRKDFWAATPAFYKRRLDEYWPQPGAISRLAALGLLHALATALDTHEPQADAARAGGAA